MAWSFTGSKKTPTSAEAGSLLNRSSLKVNSSVTNDYYTDMLGVVFIRYNNLIFPCTTYSPGDVIVFDKRNLSMSPTLEADAIKKMCKKSHAMVPENVVASFFTIRNNKIRFTHSLAKQAIGDTDVSIEHDQQDAVRMALEEYYSMKFEI